jgi:hypothetical protein
MAASKMHNGSNWSPDRFLKAFISTLVLAGHRSIPPRQKYVRRGFQRVAEMLDERTRSLLAQNAPSSEVRPWIDTSNRLRLSPTGGVDNWESALRSAQLTFTKVGNPSYELVSFDLDKARAQSELDQLSPAEREFVGKAGQVFMEQMAQAD